MAWQLAASTLGAPYDSVDQLAGICARTHVTQLEMAVGDEMLITMRSTDRELACIRHTLEEKASVSIFSLDSRVHVCDPSVPDEQLSEDLKRCLHMASVLGARYVRVFPSAPLDPCWTPDRLPGLQLPAGMNLASISRRGARVIVSTLSLADQLGVQPVLETHDSHPTGERNAMIHAAIDALAPGNQVGSIWDVAHPWRVGEDPHTTFSFLKQYLIGGRGFVQIKDCAFRGDQTPVLQGTGRVPLAEICRILAHGGYEGPLSLEWERRWYPQIPSLEKALVAARYALEKIDIKRDLE